MLVIAVSVIICISILLGSGLVIKSLLKKSFEHKSFDTLIIYGFIGLSIISGYTSLFFAINSISLAVITSLLICFLFCLTKNRKETDFLTIIKAHKPETVFFILTLLFLSLIASQEIYTFDSGLYHTQSIKWIRHFSVVPGLANFQPQFGFNSMFFPITALFTIDIESFLGDRDVLVYPLNIVLFLTISTRLFSVTLQKYRLAKTHASIFYILLLFLLFLLLSKHISSPSPDIACALIILYIGYLSLEFPLHKRNFIIYTIIILSTLILSFKLSTVMLGILCLGLLYESKNITLFYKSSLLALLVIAPYLIRNYYLSGYLIFPYTAIDMFSPDWKVPIESVSFEIGVIKAWARIPGTLKSLDMTISEWFWIWLNHQDYIEKLLIGTNILLPLVAAQNLIKKNWSASLLSLVLLVNFFFWFFTAPDTRFAYGFLFLGFALVVRELLFLLPIKSLLPQIRLVIIGFSIFCSLYFYRKQLSPTNQFISNIFIPYSYPETEVKNISIDFNYSKTINGSRCFNHVLPCNTRLTSRNYDIYQRSEKLSSGFRVVKKDKH